MLSAQFVKEINDQLASGAVAEALAHLGAIIDLRWGEIPKLEKATLTNLAAHLKAGEKATLLAQAAFDERITLRRFVKRVVHSLKQNATPLAPALSSALARFADENVAQPRRENPQFASFRKAQMEVLQEAALLLRRCDVGVFLDAAEHYAVAWGHRQRTTPPAPWQEGAIHADALERLHHFTMRHTEAIFAEYYSTQAKSLLTLRNTMPQQFQELQARVAQVPQVAKARAAVAQTLDVSDAVPLPAVVVTIGEELHNLREAFIPAMVIGRENGRPPDDFELIQTRFASWFASALESEDQRAVDRALGLDFVIGWTFLDAQWMRTHGTRLLQQSLNAKRTGTPAFHYLVLEYCALVLPYTYAKPGDIPADLTGDVVRAFKTGHAKRDRAIELTAVRLDAFTQRQQQGQEAERAVAEAYAAIGAARRDTGPAPPPAEVTPAPPPAAAPSEHEHLEVVAARATATAARLAMLREPPVALQLHSTSIIPLVTPRTELLRIWRGMAGWNEADFAGQALPVLWELLDLSLHRNAATLGTGFGINWLQSPDRNVARSTKVTPVDELAAMIDLGGLSLWPQIISHIRQAGQRGYAAHCLENMLHNLRLDNTLDAIPLPMLRDLCVERIADIEAGYTVLAHIKDHARHAIIYTHAILIVALYQADTPAARDEARAIVKNAGVYSFIVAAAAWQHRDHAVLLPLITNYLNDMRQADNNVTLLFSDAYHAATRGNDETARTLPACAALLMQKLPEATQAEHAAILLPLLEALSADLLTPHATLLSACLDSTLPQVARFALASLTKLPDAAIEWEVLCTRAGELLWSPQAGLAKDAAKFLGVVGAAQATVSQAAWDALCEGLAIEALPMQEAVLKAMVTVKAKQKTLLLDDSGTARVQYLAQEQPDRLGKVAAKLKLP